VSAALSDPRCKVCAHPDRATIDAEIAGGAASNAVVAQTHGLSKDSVRRHRDSHLSRNLQRIAQRREEAGATKALDRAEDLYRRASSVLDAAEEDGKASLSLAAVRELRGIVELLAKLTGELDERPQVQVLAVSTSPEWAATRAALPGALAPFPEAGAAVALALAEVES
jgi:hypothetical protein